MFLSFCSQIHPDDMATMAEPGFWARVGMHRTRTGVRGSARTVRVRVRVRELSN
jgi:hypothetical protein